MALWAWLLPQAGLALPWPVLVASLLLLAGFDVFIYVMGTKSLERRPEPGMESMVGLKGIAVTDLDPTGHVQVSGELWTARSSCGPIGKGSRVEVMDQHKMALVVKPAPR